MRNTLTPNDSGWLDGGLTKWTPDSIWTTVQPDVFTNTHSDKNFDILMVQRAKRLNFSTLLLCLVMDLSPGIAGYRISNPPPLLCAPLEASLKVIPLHEENPLNIFNNYHHGVNTMHHQLMTSHQECLHLQVYNQTTMEDLRAKSLLLTAYLELLLKHYYPKPTTQNTENSNGNLYHL